MDAEHLKTTIFVGAANVDFAVETTKASQRRVNRVGAVGGADDNHVGTLLEPVHKGKHLGHDTALNLTVGLVALWGDRVDLVDEDDRRGILLGLLKGLAQVAF